MKPNPILTKILQDFDNKFDKDRPYSGNIYGSLDKNFEKRVKAFILQAITTAVEKERKRIFEELKMELRLLGIRHYGKEMIESWVN